jgi:hypothetical protein
MVLFITQRTVCILQVKYIYTLLQSRSSSEPKLNMGCEVLLAENTIITFFTDVTPSSLVDMDQHFCGISCLHIHLPEHSNIKPRYVLKFAILVSHTNFMTTYLAVWLLKHAVWQAQVTLHAAQRHLVTHSVNSPLSTLLTAELFLLLV